MIEELREEFGREDVAKREAQMLEAQRQAERRVKDKQAEEDHLRAIMTRALDAQDNGDMSTYRDLIKACVTGFGAERTCRVERELEEERAAPFVDVDTAYEDQCVATCGL